MNETGVIRKVDAVGRVVIPMELRKLYNIEIEDYVEITLEENCINIKKYEEFYRCAITGDITPENREYGNNLVLSPLGAEILFNQLRERKKDSFKE